MTDHSILNQGVADLPFHREARLLSAILTTLFVDMPRAFAQAIKCQTTFEELYLVDAPNLAALRRPGHEIATFAARDAGILRNPAD